MNTDRIPDPGQRIPKEMISETEARELSESKNLITIGVKADEVRRRLHGARTTFVRVFEIHVDAPLATLPPRTSAGEFRIIGSPKSVEAAAGAVRGAKALAGSTVVTGFSLGELSQFDGGSSLRDSCRVLREAGLDAIAEVPIDALENPARTIATARDAGLVITRLTVNAARDHDRGELARRARDLQEEIGGFRTFAPLPRLVSIASPTTGYDDVKQIALARLIADNIESIQVDWQLYGPKLAQFALTVGADDVDSVAAVDPGTLGTRRSPLEEIRGNIKSAGLEPVERNGRFEAIG
jgi:aminodeoxyfutalosine synthase